MKREEAIKTLTSLKEQYEIAVRATEHVGIKAGFKDAYDAINTALIALRPVSREQVEKVWRSEWKVIGADKRGRHGIPYCMRCEKCNPYKSEFCPHCGSPMTDEAVDILHKRLEALKDGTEAN